MGYVWGKSSERICVPVVNERQRQTYFGALNYYSHQFVVKADTKANSQSTIAFLEYLQTLYPQKRLALFWDGASASNAQLNSKFTYILSINICQKLSGLLPVLD